MLFLKKYWSLMIKRIKKQNRIRIFSRRKTTIESDEPNKSNVKCLSERKDVFTT